MRAQGPWRLIEPPDKEDPEGPLLALADAGEVSAALDGFRKQAETEFGTLLALDDRKIVDAYFEGAPEEDIRWLNDDAKRCWGVGLRDALRTYDGYARDNVAWGGEWDIDPCEVSRQMGLVVQPARAIGARSRPPVNWVMSSQGEAVRPSRRFAAAAASPSASSASPRSVPAGRMGASSGSTCGP